ncbi:MAG: sulfurtransferase [Chloroflexi bacterium]|nr:sulfurtransferase [Chloroflexota bacterium]
MVITVLALAVTLAGCATGSTPTPATTPTTQPAVFANPELLVDTEWLADHLDDPNVRVVDVRKAESYNAGHIRNAVNLDTTNPAGPMYDQTNPVKWTVLPEDKLESLFTDLGIRNDTIVVAVDDARMLWASRLFWTLEYYGHGDGKARVLDGGLKKWQAENRLLTAEVPIVQRATLVNHPAVPDRMATKDQILAWLGQTDTTILATIPLAEFSGGNTAGHVKGGHIPGALQLDWTENLTSGDVPVFKTAVELAPMYQAKGVTKDKNTILY